MAPKRRRELLTHRLTDQVASWQPRTFRSFTAAATAVEFAGMAPPTGAPRVGVHVFAWPGGRPYKPWDVRKQFELALGRCSVIPDEKKESVVIHTLRHTAASLMVAAGVPIFDVAKVLGHSTLQVTMRYAHFAPEAGRSAIDALDRRLRPPSNPEGGVAEGIVSYGAIGAPEGTVGRLRYLPGGAASLVAQRADLSLVGK